MQDAELITALRGGNEHEFSSLVSRHHAHLVRAAVTYVRDRATAEDVVQETWLGFLDSIDRFEGRCSVKTWLFRILFNKAKSRAVRDARMVPFSSLACDEVEEPWTSVDPSRFIDPDAAMYANHWRLEPRSWNRSPDEIVESREVRALVRDAIEGMPPAQATVFTLRDVNGLPSDEVCNVLGISGTNQRVLLHRARTRVRRALSERYGGRCE